MIHIIPIGAIIILLLLNYNRSKNILRPSVFLYAIWLCFYMMHWLFGDGMFISFSSISCILFFLFMFNLGDLFSANKKIKGIYNLRLDSKNEKSIKRFIYLFSTLSIVFSLVYFYIFVSYYGGFAMYMAADLRAGMAEIPVPFVVRIPMLFSYTLAILSAVYYVFYGDLKCMLYSTLPILIAGIAQNGRAGFLMMAFMVFITIVLRQVVFIKKKSKAINRMLVKYSIILSCIGIAIFVGGAVLRFRNMENDGASFFLDSFKSYLLGGMSAFDTFLQHPDTPDVGYGRYNFSSLYGLLGIATNEVGVYTNYIPFNKSGDTTNIFTLFRPIIDDFGYFFGSIYLFVLGTIGGTMYKKMMLGDVAALSFMILFYTYLFHSPFLPITVHNSILFSFFIPSIIIKKYSYYKKC